MSYKIFVTNSFKRQVKRLAKKYPSLKSDLSRAMDSIAENPIQGKSLGKDCFKIRMAISSKGKGKSGGSRLISCVKIVNESVYLLAIYDKTEKDSISDNELIELLQIAGLI